MKDRKVFPFFLPLFSMFSACVELFREGKLRECEDKLQKIIFPKFDVAEWTKENNILVCKLQVGFYIRPRPWPWLWLG